ncbi:MAG TPA: transglutaminase-like domain-containing protein [Pirellulales bacterium]|nr:transglutaminase-like domain-containing protein [Pirellulales bacterium]
MRLHSLQREAARWLLLAVIFATGCNASSDRASQNKKSAAQSNAEPAAASDGGDQSAYPADGETWHIIEMGGNRVGYDHQTLRKEDRDGQRVLLTEVELQMSIQRYGEPSETINRYSTLETLDGKLLSFTSQWSPADSTGKVDNGVLTIETKSAGKKTTQTIEWPDDAGGFFAVEHSLRRKPMQPGETRTLRYLQPGFNTLCTDELAAVDYESTELRSGAHDLLRIESQTHIQGSEQPMAGIFWVDRSGDVLKSEMPSVGLVFYRATQAEATDAGPQAPFDLGLSSVVPLDQPFESARQTRRAIYRVELRESDPAAVFPAGATQQLRATGPHTAELVVTSLDPQSPPADIEPATPPTDGDREPNSLIQSDDAAIVAMSREAAGAKKSPLSKALALERYVHDNIREKNFATTFASAAEVAKQMSGDCSEHAVLLAALARAAEIPARAAIGLVYAPSEGGFAYHMWNEFYIEGRWVPFDATLGEGRVGADHLKLADSDLRDATGLVSFLPVVQVLGKLKIELVEAE